MRTCPLADLHPTEKHRLHATEGGDVRSRIAIESDEVSNFSHLDRADVVEHANSFGGEARRRLQCLTWRESGLHEKLQVVVEVAEGEKIVMWYTAANRDHRRFHDPYRFDILRSPNHQGGFGTGGAHFCLGANLARREIAITMTELLRAFPDIDVDGPIEKARSNFLHIITALPVRYTPT